MSLFLASFITGIAMLLMWIFPLFCTAKSEYYYKGFLRSKIVGNTVFAIASVWFLYYVLNLSQADFGDFKMILAVIFGLTSIGAFVYTPDFLSVRGVCILTLLWGLESLKSAFMQEPSSRLVLVSVIYISIILAIYFGAFAYQVRDIFEYLWKKPIRIKILSFILSLIGITLCLISFTYHF